MIDSIKKLREMQRDVRFKKLDKQTRQFNIFEALGVCRRELRHSDFLAFLFNPKGNHGIGNIFLQNFLDNNVDPSFFKKKQISKLLNKGSVYIKREWRNIDLVIEINKSATPLVVVIENKIDAAESDGQLERYRKTIEMEYTNHELVFFYLTPDGRPPSEDNIDTWQSISYERIDECLNNLISSWDGRNTEFFIMAKHYSSMLRKHIMENDSIKTICRELYNDHKEAIDLIIENIPSLNTDIKDYIDDVVNKDSRFISAYSTNTYIRFLPQQLIREELNASKGWGKVEQILLLEFQNLKDKLLLKLVLGPTENKNLQNKLFEWGSKNYPERFHCPDKMNKRWTDLYSMEFFEHKESTDIEDYKALFQEKWDSFIKDDLSDLVKIADCLN